jgi:hypothetical protein
MHFPVLGFHDAHDDGSIDWNASESLLLPGTFLVILLLLIIVCDAYVQCLYAVCMQEDYAAYDTIEHFIEV